MVSAYRTNIGDVSITVPNSVTKGIIIVDASCWMPDGVVSLSISGATTTELIDEINTGSTTHLTKKIYKCDLSPNSTVKLTVGKTGSVTSHLSYVGASISLIY